MLIALFSAQLLKKAKIHPSLEIYLETYTKMISAKPDKSYRVSPSIFFVKSQSTEKKRNQSFPIILM